MNNWIEQSNFTAVFLDAALKSGIVLIVAGVCCVCWRRASAATRHWLWFLAMSALLVMPLLSLIQPPWQKPVWHISTDLDAANRFSVAIQFEEFARPVDQTPQVAAATKPVALRTDQRALNAFNRRWLLIVPVIWLSGVLLVLFYSVIARMRLRMIHRHARAPENVGWTTLLDDLRREWDLRRRVILLQSPDRVMPMTWGWRRPVILLPAEADEWPPERQRVVLLHELAHVKRWDCLTQAITRVVCALYWFNPLVWLAARQMRLERERACDDLVLTRGWKASAYAGLLVEIAGAFRRVPQTAAIAMARSSGLERRVTAILDGGRNRKRLARLTGGLLVLAAAAFGLFISACATTRKSTADQWSLDRSEVGDQLKRFVAEKKAQAFASAKPEGREILPEYKAMFAAAERGDWRSISNLWENMRARAPQYEGSGKKDPRLHGTAWQTMLEIWGSFGHFALGEEKENVHLGQEAIASIKPGSIYFGGTDPGRFVITALQTSHVNADPFFTITQNALADGSYLQYVRRMYGDRIYTPTDQDSQRSFSEYLNDIQQRHKENRLKPGEDYKIVDNRVQVSGQVAVMSINALLARIIFDKNPDREFYVEESFPLDWMYPYLTPNGPIMKINRQALSELSEDIVRKDREYWMRLVQPMIGDWLNDGTTVQQIAAFATKTYTRQRKPDQYYHSGTYMAGKWASKLRSSIAGVYAWRAQQAANEPEKARMRREADFAFRQALALCPFSPEAVFRYANLLVSQQRISEALVVAETGAKLQPNDQYHNLIKELQKLQKGN